MHSFVLESHRTANQAKCWNRLSTGMLDLVLVIGHALFGSDKVITCYLFRLCPLQSAEWARRNMQFLHTLSKVLHLKLKSCRNLFQFPFVKEKKKKHKKQLFLFPAFIVATFLSSCNKCKFTRQASRCAAKEWNWLVISGSICIRSQWVKAQSMLCQVKAFWKRSTPITLRY